MIKNTKLLQAQDIEHIITRTGLTDLMDTLIGRLEKSFTAYNPALAQIPARDGLHYKNPDLGLLEWMPVYLDKEGIAIKLVGYHPTNPVDRNVPSVLSTITLFDSQSGHLKGIVDGTILTALRTGAVSAVASSLLARPDSSTVGVIGAGAQAVTQVFALSRRFPIKRVLCFDTDAATALSLGKRIAFLDIAVETVESHSLQRLVEESDILCTCTSEEPGNGPVFADTGNRSHLHINAVGSDFHGKVEVPLSLIKRSTVCPDFPAQALHEGECQQIDPESMGPDITELLRNPMDYMELKDSLTVFDSTGWALADHVVATMMLDYASRYGVGTEVSLECIPRDPKDPFSFMSGWHGGIHQSAVAASKDIMHL